MAVNGIGGGTPVAVPQAANVGAAAAPAAGAADGGQTQEAIEQNMMQEAGMQGIMQLGQEVQQEALKIEQKNQARAKEMLAEAKKDG